MKDCLFCKIANKEIGAEVVYEAGRNMAFMDIHPRAPGHAIVIPKVHRETILDAKKGELGSLFSAVKKTTELISMALRPDGFTIGINHGKRAGQEIDHLHVHIMPRYSGDKGNSIQSVVDNKSDEPVHEIAERIRKKMKISIKYHAACLRRCFGRQASIKK